jgi:hypothetical protein
VGTYGVADLTHATTEGVQIEAIGEVSSEKVAAQLKDIRDAILSTVIDEEPQPGRIGLTSVEIALTVGTEGRIWFIAKRSIEASIKLVFSRSTGGGSGGG